MRYFELTEGRDAPLYHGTNVQAAAEILRKNAIDGQTPQFGWPFKHKVRGISLSRDINVSKTFGKVIFVLDQRKLAQRYRIEPFDYFESPGYLGLDKNIRKRATGESEAEEFLIGSIKPLDAFLVQLLVQKNILDHINKVGGESNINPYAPIVYHPLLKSF